MDYAALMREALALALRGRGAVEPNPRVGALALRAGAVVGRGWHRGWGEPHAEIEALADAASHGARADTVVVTLEPCDSAQGLEGKKTGSCTAALLAAGVQRVVFGQTDPDPRHGGRGAARLEQAGVEVIAGVEREACAGINLPFARALTLSRPWTIAKWAMSLDGKIATRTGDSRWISGEPARRAVHALRARVDAVAVGFRTVLRDDPLLTVREVSGPSPVRIVVDPEAGLPLAAQLVRTARDVPVLAVVGERASADRCAALAAAGVEILQVAGAGARGLDLAAGWRALRSRGLRRVLVEGGGALLAALFAADAVDQVLAFVAPVVIGGRSAPTPVMGEGIEALGDAVRFAETTVVAIGSDAAVTAIR